MQVGRRVGGRPPPAARSRRGRRPSTASPVAAASADGARTGTDRHADEPDGAAPHHVGSSSSCTATVAPAMAKSPCRRANSSTAKPHRPVQIGNDTATSSSSGSSAVDHRPVKKSAAGTTRGPGDDRTSRSASRATATAGYSAAGSAWAIDPPMVPRLRIWRWPMRASPGPPAGRRPDVGDVLDLGIGRRRADPHRAVPVLDARSAPIRPTSTRRSNTARRRASRGPGSGRRPGPWPRRRARPGGRRPRRAWPVRRSGTAPPSHPQPQHDLTATTSLLLK